MFFACILLTVGVAGGTLLTFVYQRECAVTSRLCMGACTGLALMATFSFILSAFLGLTATSVVLSAGLLLLPAVLLATMMGGFRPVLEHSRSSRWASLFYVGLAVVLALAFAQNMIVRPVGIRTADANNLGDLPFHLQVTSSLVYGQNIPVEDPTYAGARFTYPILADFLTAMLVRVGAPMASAIWLQSMILVLALVGLLHHWTRGLTHDRLAAFLAPVLVIFSGGLGWWLLMQDLRGNDGGLISLLGHLPRDYTIAGDTLFRWGNSLTTLLLPERSFLFGLPLAVFVFHQWWTAIEFSESIATQRETESVASNVTRRMLVAGIAAGLLPLIHTHGFVVVVGTGVCLALLFRSLWRGWLVFLAAALLIGLPEVYWLSHGSAVDSSKFIGWQFGWDRANYNPVWFWFVNTGCFIPLVVAAVWQRSGYAVPRRLTIFYAPFALWFLVPNMLKLSPWIWDNIKFLFYWYAASAPFVAFVLARLLQQRSRRRWIAAGLVATLTLSGGLDILRLITHPSEWQEFTPAGIQMANLIDVVAAPRAVVLHAPDWDSPAYLTGRRTLLGYAGWVWSRGLDSARRQADITTMYSGGPEAKTLLKSYQVDYVLVGPSERADERVNQAFWAGCPKLAEIGEYQLYKADCNP